MADNNLNYAADWRGLIIPLAVFCFGTAALAACFAKPAATDWTSFVVARAFPYIFDDYRDRAFYLWFCAAVFAALWPVRRLCRFSCEPVAGKGSGWINANLFFVPAATGVLWYWQNSRVHVYYGAPALFFAGAAGAAVAWPRLVPRFEKLLAFIKPAARKIGFKTAFFIAAAFCAGGLLPAIFTERSLGTGFFNVYNHIHFTMAEFAAVLDGRTPLTDFFPQYQILAPYLLCPVFKITGFGVFSYTCAVCALSLGGLLCVWLALRKVAGEAVALMLFLVFAASAFYPAQRAGAEVYYMFNYYAMPLRYFACWGMALALVWAMEKPASRARLGLNAVLAAFAACNNFDFGAAAWLASLFSLLVVRRDRRRVLFAYFAAAAGIAAVYCGVSLARCGSLPDFARVMDFQRLFGMCGLMAAPMPLMGAHILMLAVFAASVFCGLVSGGRNAGLSVLLVYSGVFGLGAFAYYAGRSLPGTLLFLFPQWVLCNTLLLLCLNKSSRPGAAVFKWFLSGHLVLFACTAFMLPGPAGQLKRIAGGTDRFCGAYGQMLSVLERAARPGEKVAVATMNGHRLALDARLDNVFPFASQDSIVFKSQARLAVAIMTASGAGKLFGPVPPEMEEMLARAGYARCDGQDIWLKTR
ncbi:MAG: hypothetical protein PHW69_08375 [Elusimicrobiaceae bacterium]|nr:hypothetical protein [Elusimicrobiaceae bacterium]